MGLGLHSILTGKPSSYLPGQDIALLLSTHLSVLFAQPFFRRVTSLIALDHLFQTPPTLTFFRGVQLPEQNPMLKLKAGSFLPV